MVKWYSGTLGPKASWHLSYRWGKTPKKPHPGNLSQSGIEPGPAAWQARMLPLVPQRWTRVMVVMVMPSYGALLCLMKPGPAHTSLFLSANLMSGIITGHHAKVVHRTLTNVKVMVIVAYDCNGVILTHAIPQWQNVNAQYFRHFLENNLRPELRRKRPHFLQNPPIILQDNAWAHTAHPVADLYRRWRWKVLFTPPQSPDISPCDYNLIPKLEEPLRNIRFQTVPDILRAVRQKHRLL